MADDNPQKNLIGYLTQWRALCERQKDALVRGDITDLEKHLQQSVLIQAKTDEIISRHGLNSLGQKAIDLMADIRKTQSALLCAVQEGMDVVDGKIKTLRKNRSSLMKYKPKPAAAPRFFSSRT